MSAQLESLLSPAQRAQAEAADRHQAAYTAKQPLPVGTAIDNAERALGRPRSADEAPADPVGRLLSGFGREAAIYAERRFPAPAEAIARTSQRIAYRDSLIVAELRRLHTENAKLRAVAKEAVQAIEDRARDAFDVKGNMTQDALEAAWEDEAPADYAQFKRLWFGAQA